MSQATALSVGEDDLRIARRFVMRIAAWSIETLDFFEARDLASRANRLAQQDSVIEADQQALADELYRVIPSIEDRAARRWLLGVRRITYQGLEPWPAPSDSIEASLVHEVPELLAQLEQARLTRAERRTLAIELELMHRSSLDKQRIVLRELAASPAFCRALALANPRVAAQWLRHLRNQVKRTKAIRQLESTVLCYLLRAMGRTTPQGAWAGTVVVSVDPDTTGVRCKAAKPRQSVAPDLRPFRRVVEHLAQTPPYLRGYPLRMDPVAFCDHRGWHGLDHNGQWTCVLPDPAVSTLADNFRDGRVRRVEPLVALLISRAHSAVHIGQMLEDAIIRMQAAGILRSALEFPAAPASSWSALEAVSDQLLEPVRSVWVRTLLRCRAVCKSLSENYDKFDATQIIACHDDMRSAIDDLYKASGLYEPISEALLMMDRTAPFEIVVSEVWFQTLRRGCATVLSLHADIGAAEAFRAGMLGGVRDATLPLVDAIQRQDEFEGNATMAAQAAWDAWMQQRNETTDDSCAETSRDKASSGAKMGASGTLCFGLGDAAYPLWFRWGRPQADFALFRLRKLLGQPNNDPATDRSPEASGIEPLEVVGIDAPNPNATVRESLATEQIGRHVASSKMLSRWWVMVDSDGRPWLAEAPKAKRRLPTYSVAAGIGVHDPVGRFLLRLAMSHGWEYLAYGFPLPATCREQHADDPVRVPIVCESVQLACWVLSRRVVQTLRCRTGVDRYRAWRRVIQGAAVGSRAWLGPLDPNAGPPMLLYTDSPLMVDTVVGRMSTDFDELLLSNLPGNPHQWPVIDRDGGHHYGEVAVTWDYPMYEHRSSPQ